MEEERRFEFKFDDTRVDGSGIMILAPSWFPSPSTLSDCFGLLIDSNRGASRLVWPEAASNWCRRWNMRDTEVGVGVVGEKVVDDETNVSEIEFEAVVKPGPSTSTGCMFEVGGCWEPLINPLFSPLREKVDSELEELDELRWCVGDFKENCSSSSLAATRTPSPSWLGFCCEIACPFGCPFWLCELCCCCPSNCVVSIMVF